MAEKTVLFEQRGSIGIITLNQPERKNALTSEMATELRTIRSEIGWDSPLAVLILTAAGPDFCGGTDPSELQRFDRMEDRLVQLSAASVIASFRQPTLAVVRGKAFGQGLELALACDLRLCSEDASFALPQLSEGTLPFDGGTQRLPRLIGRLRAMEMILTGRIVAAAEAQTIGLVHQVLANEALTVESRKTAEDLAAKGPVALRYAKEAVLKGMDMTLEQGLRLEADLYFLLQTTQDRREGITAFREKRTPQFEGQ